MNDMKVKTCKLDFVELMKDLNTFKEAMNIVEKIFNDKGKELMKDHNKLFAFITGYKLGRAVGREIGKEDGDATAICI